MLHIPWNKAWDTKAVGEALVQRGLKPEICGELIKLTVPIEKHLNVEAIVNAQTPEDLRREIVGQIVVRLSHQPEAMLANLVLAWDYFQCPSGCYPRIREVTEALLACGYQQADERELAKSYYQGELDLDAIFAQLDAWQLSKEDAVADGRFEDAAAARDQQLPLRKQIEEMLRRTRFVN